MNEKAGHLRNLFFCLLAFVEVVSACFQPQVGIISSLFAGWRQTFPQSGFVAEITSSSFIALALSLPLLMDSSETAHSFRKNVLLIFFPFIASRRSEVPLKFITVAASVCFALVFIRSLSLFFTEGLLFAHSLSPFALFCLSYLLRFVLLNPPQANEIFKPGGNALEQIGEIEHTGIYTLPPRALSIHIDYQQDQETARIHTGPRSVAKRQNELAIMVHPDTAFVSDIKALVQLPHTDISLRIDVTVTRHPEQIQIMGSRLRTGIPTETTILTEVKRLVDTRLLQAIRQDPLFIAMAEYTEAYLHSQPQLIARDVITLESMIANMEHIRQKMNRLARDFALQLAEAEQNETYALYGQMLYCRIYVDEIGMNADSQQAFERMRHDIRTILDAMREDRLGEIAANADLLRAVENLDIPHIEIQRILKRSLPGLDIGNSVSPAEANPLSAAREPDRSLLPGMSQDAPDTQAKAMLFGQSL